ncbi:hypothetical protein H3C66_02030 [Patescibacteria group bacterium]|nr:hypothetical protein [Patescibacteria group bacterium]
MDTKGDAQILRERAVHARASFDVLSSRVLQYELYEGVTFPPEHIVGNDRMIPVKRGELILAPGHLDPLYQLGLVEDEELYKISQNTLREGIQRGTQTIVHFKDSLTKMFRPDEQRSVSLKKEEDLVFGKVKLASVLHRQALSHPDVQAVFLQLIEQQTGQLSLRFLFQLTQRELRELRKQPGNEEKIRQLRIDVEIACRRMLTQELSISDFVVMLRKQRPDMASIYKLDGKKLFVDNIEKYLEKDIGKNRTGIDEEKLIQRIMSELFDKTDQA